MRDDPIVTSVRRVREELAAAFKFDVHAIFEDVRKRESNLGDRLIHASQMQASVMAVTHDASLEETTE